MAEMGRGRGRGRGRMAARGRGRGLGNGPAVGNIALMMQELKRLPPEKVWDRTRDLETAGRDPVLRDFRKLATFNWDSGEAVPVMFVPGEPRILNKWGGGQLDVDSDVVPLLDENRERLPMYPLEPMFRAVELCSGQPLDPNQYDIITTRKNLRQLFLFCDVDRVGANYYWKQDPFRMDVERKGKTVFLMRRDPAAEDQKQSNINNPYYKTFGRHYEQACAPPPKEPLLHGMFREVLSYQLGGLKLLVNSEVDCVIPDGATNDKSDTHQPEGEDDLVKKMGGLSVENPQPPLSPQPFALDSPLQYLKLGSVPKSYKTVELASRRKNAKFRTEVFAKMYFSQTELLYFGQHQDGSFDPPQLLTIDQVSKLIGGFPKTSLWRVASLLHKLVSFVQSFPEQQRFALVWFPFDRNTGEFNNPCLNLFQKEPVRQGTPGDPVMHAMPESLQKKTQQKVGQATVLSDVDGAFD